VFIMQRCPKRPPDTCFERYPSGAFRDVEIQVRYVLCQVCRMQQRVRFEKRPLLTKVLQDAPGVLNFVRSTPSLCVLPKPIAAQVLNKPLCLGGGRPALMGATLVGFPVEVHSILPAICSATRLFPVSPMWHQSTNSGSVVSEKTSDKS